MSVWQFSSFALYRRLFKPKMNRFGLLLLLSVSFSQNRIGDWESFTSPLFIKDMVALDDRIVCATEGGLLVFNTADKVFTNLTNIDELMGTDIGSVAIDRHKHVWIGGRQPDGFIQIYDLNQRRSIAKFDYDLSEIISFAVSDSLIYGAYRDNQDWGLVEFILEGDEFIFRDVYRNWPLALSAITDVEIWNDSVLVSTDQGLFVGNWRTSNLKDPASWSRPYPIFMGNITAASLYGDTLLIVQDRIVYLVDLRNDETPLLVWDYYVETNYNLITAIQTDDGDLWTILPYTFSKTKANGIDWSLRPGYKFTSLIETNDGTIIAGTENGLAVLDKDNRSFQRYIPNAPLSNQFTAVTVLNDGRVVVASERGLAIKEREGWRNIVSTRSNDLLVHDEFDYSYFAADTVPVDFGRGVGNFVADLEQGPDGFVYCAVRGTNPEPYRHGGGVVIIDIDNPWNYTLIDTNYLDYFTTSTNPIPYLVVKDLTFDRDDNLWVANPFAINKLIPVQVRNNKGEWGSYSVSQSNNVLSLTPNTIEIDSWGRVWVGSFQNEVNAKHADGGLALLVYSGDPAEPDDFQWSSIKLSLDPEFSTRTVWSLAITPDNTLYALTPLGLRVLELQYSNTDPVLRYNPFTYFPNISYSSGSKLKLDARNNVWTLSPSDGIHVLLSNASYWPDEDPNVVVEAIQKENTPLLSNEVTDIDFDNNLGIAYIATNKGLSVFRIPFAKKKESYSNLKVFPSPFHIPAPRPLVIDGLEDNSSLKVMLLNGEVVRSIMDSDLGEHGYQLQWDGRDESGNWVNSGVYLLSVFNPRGGNGFAKVVVIRH